MKKIVKIEELKSKKRKKRKRRIRALVFIVIIIYFVIRSIPSLVTSFAKTTPAERITYIDNIELEGIVLKDEKVYLSNGEKAEYTKENGEKVRVGEVIGINSQGNIVSEVSGIVSYDNIDGLEKDIMLEEITLENIMESTYKEKEIKSSNGIKIIKGQNWKIAGKTTLEYVDFFNKKKTEGQNINIHIDGKELSGKVEEVLKEDDSLKVLISGGKNIQDIYNLRNIKFKVNRKSYEGLKIPSSSVYKKGSKQGVFIKDIGGIVKFIPIKIIYKNKDFVIVEDEKDSNKKVFLRVYDEVFIKSSLIRENQIYN